MLWDTEVGHNYWTDEEEDTSSNLHSSKNKSLFNFVNLSGWQIIWLFFLSTCKSVHVQPSNANSYKFSEAVLVTVLNNRSWSCTNSNLLYGRNSRNTWYCKYLIMHRWKIHLCLPPTMRKIPEKRCEINVMTSVRHNWACIRFQATPVVLSHAEWYIFQIFISIIGFVTLQRPFQDYIVMISFHLAQTHWNTLNIDWYDILDSVVIINLILYL